MNSLCECGCGQAAPIAPKTDTRVGHIKGQPQRFVAGHQCRRPIPVELLTLAGSRSGLCACGCGQRTTIPKASGAGRFRGVPARYVSGHNSRGATHPMWKGGRKRDRGGPDAYIEVLDRSHPRANTSGYVKEHRLVAERALGKPLPKTARVHHVNEVRTENGQDNLVICQDHAYHVLLHGRMRALQATGDVHSRQCVCCGGWLRAEDPELVIRGHQARAFHRQCLRDRRRRWRQGARKRRGLIIHQPKPCMQCGTSFTPLHQGDRYCSPACRRSARRR